MLRVIEPDVKALVECRGKSFQRRVVAVDVRVADHAHRHSGRCELAAVTVCARFVTGKPRRGRVVCSFMTRATGNGAVTLSGVKKL